MLRNLLRGAGFALAYAAVAVASLQFASVHVSASPVWPPAGLAIGALAIWGRRLWPAVFVGAFVANWLVSGHAPSSLVIALGNAGEAVLGATILRRWVTTEWGAQASHAAALFAAAVVAGALSAGVGVGALVLFDLAPASAMGAIGTTWALGNIAGTMVVAPLLLAAQRPRWMDWGLLAIGAGVGGMAFLTSGIALVFLIPVIFWAAQRGSARTQAWAVLGITAGATAATARGNGPFNLSSPAEATLLLQLFIILFAAAVLLQSAGRHVRQSRFRQGVAFAAAALTLAPLLAGVIAVGTALQPTLEELGDRRREELHGDVVRSWSDIITDQGDQLQTLRALFQSTNVTTASFAQFVQDTGWQFGPGQSTAIGYSPIVAHEDVPAFEATVRADMDLPTIVRENFSVFPPSPGPFHAPVLYVYPLDPQPGAIGFDLYLNETRAAALFASAGTRTPQASAPVEIVRPEGNDLGMMLALPVVRDGQVVGYVISATALPNAESAPPSPAGVEYRVVDVTAGDKVLFTTSEAAWSDAQSLTAWGREWRLEFSTPLQATSTESAAAWFLVGTGGILSVSIALVVYAYDTSRDKALRLGDAMAVRAREDEKRKAEMRRLEDVDAFRRRFLNMASHELRTPLTPILAHAEMLQLHKVPEIQPSVAVLLRSARRLRLITDDLLLAAKVEAGELPLDLQPIDLAQVVRESVQAHQAPAEQAGTTVEGVFEATPVIADGQRVAQIADNLLTNAIKFAPGGRVSVWVGDDGGPVLRVQDDGHGIDAAVLETLGEPFMQAKDSPGGTGLGLYISRMIADLHGGSLEITSPGLGAGATFTLRLPGPPAED